MKVQEILAALLLTFGIVLQLFAIAGILVMRDAFDRAHYAAAGTTFGPFLVASAIVVAGSAGELDVKAFIVAGLLVAGSPVLTHATVRAARVRVMGDDHIERGDIERSQVAAHRRGGRRKRT